MPYETTQSVTGENWITRVHWHKVNTTNPDDYDGSVGLQTVQHDSGLFIPKVEGQGSEPEPPEPLDGWCVWHDRDQINRIIRLLRKARDRAWGPDA